MKKIRKAVAALMLMTAVFIAAGCSKPDEPNNGGDNNGGNGGGGGNGSGSGIYNGNYEFVDLGLPSGTLWATFNVGAGSPEDEGDKFAWGETEPKETYSWDNYKYCNPKSKHVVITKYNDSDGLEVLETADDAATTKWGSDWRMPTAEQLHELVDNTTGTSTTQNGKKGRLFTAANGRSIFLPNTDTVNYSSGPCQVGLYWSSSLLIDPYKEMARDMIFEWEIDYCGYGSDWNYRFCGHAIRPVRSTK